MRLNEKEQDMYPEDVKPLVEALKGHRNEMTGFWIDECDEWVKDFVESYRCRICKTSLNLNNFGGLGPNHGIFCKNCI